jgi:hypothetical protein
MENEEKKIFDINNRILPRVNSYINVNIDYLDNIYKGIIKDISFSGAKIKIIDEFKLKREKHVKLNFDLDSKNLYILAKIIRKNKTEMGVEFIEQNEVKKNK